MKNKFVLSAVVVAALLMSGCRAQENSESDEESTESGVITDEYCFVPKSDVDKMLASQRKKTDKWDKRAQNILDFINDRMSYSMGEYLHVDNYSDLTYDQRMEMQEKMKNAQESFIKEYGQQIIDKANKILEGFKKDCPNLNYTETIGKLEQLKNQLSTMLKPMNQADTQVLATDEATTPNDEVEA